jgi:hypothetical protein
MDGAGGNGVPPDCHQGAEQPQQGASLAGIPHTLYLLAIDVEVRSALGNECLTSTEGVLNEGGSLPERLHETHKLQIGCTTSC